jgi:hypothetical protein
MDLVGAAAGSQAPDAILGAWSGLDAGHGARPVARDRRDTATGMIGR